MIKNYYDKYRGTDDLPPEISGVVKGRLMPDQPLMDKWRNWRTGLEYIDKKRKAKLFGALDDCVIEGNAYIPLDYKTRGYPPKEGDSKRYYGNQLNCYTLMLKENGYKIADYGYLVYYYPKSVRKKGIVNFNVKPVKIEVNAEEGRKTFEAALDLLAGPEPKEHSDCEYCSWSSQLLEEFD